MRRPSIAASFPEGRGTARFLLAERDECRCHAIATAVVQQPNGDVDGRRRQVYVSLRRGDVLMARECLNRPRGSAPDRQMRTERMAQDTWRRGEDSRGAPLARLGPDLRAGSMSSYQAEWRRPPAPVPFAAVTFLFPPIVRHTDVHRCRRTELRRVCASDCHRVDATRTAAEPLS
jgi:hypothetical protein